jgi:hypothetical protein
MTDVLGDPCITLPDEPPPAGCLLECDVVCDECAAPSGVDCQSNACVPLP